MTDGNEIEVSVVSPAYNEEDTLEATVEIILDTLDDFLPTGTFEIIVAEDGCDDRTPEIASRMEREDKRVRHFHSDERLGRGGALTRAFEVASGNTLVYLDADRATEMRYLKDLIEYVRSGEYDVATGSRWTVGHEADRPVERAVLSKGYNFLVRTVLRSDLRDHQCGFKAVSREAFRSLKDNIEDDHWFWDTELLVRAQRAGLAVKEFPVEWEPKGNTKVDFIRDVLGMGSQILRLWWQVSIRPRLTPRVSFAAGLLLVLTAALVLAQYYDPSQVFDEIRQADIRLVAVAAGVYVLSWPLRGIRYRNILEELGHSAGIPFLTGAVFISQTANLVFPARGGDAIRAYILKVRKSVPYPTGFASLAIERVFDLLTLAALACLVLVGYLAAGRMDLITETVTASRGNSIVVIAALTVVLFVCIAIAGIVLSARSETNHVRAMIGRVSEDSYADYVASVVEQFVADLQQIGVRSRALLAISVASTLVWTLDTLTAAIVLAAFDVGLDPVTLLGVCFFAVSVGNLAKVLPLSPGGIGLYEGAFTLSVVGLTPIGAPVALGAAILDHMLKSIVGLAGGGVSLLAFNISLTTAVEKGQEASNRQLQGTDTEDL